MKVLIVDDEPSVRRALRRALEIRGHVVHEAEDGRIGLKRWQDINPDVVFLDILMPGLTGPELLQQMSGVNRSQVILMSAYVADYDIEHLRRLGAKAFETKPFEDIFSVVTRAEEILGVTESAAKD